MPRARFLTVVTAAVFALCATPRVAHAQSSNEAAAQLRFAHGRELFAAHRWGDALVEFRATVALVGSPNTRLYLARCLHNLGRNAEAQIEYQRTATEAADRANTEPRYAATRDAARTEAAAIENTVGHLTIHLEGTVDGLRVTADGNAISAAALDLRTPFDPHVVSIHAEAPGREPFDQTVTVEAERDAEITVHLEPAPEQIAVSSAPPPPAFRTITVRQGGAVRLAGIAVGGVGLVAGIVGTAVFGSMAQSQFNALAQSCVAPCADMQAQVIEGERNRTLTNVSIGVGAGLLVAGVVMIAVGGPREVQRNEPVARAPRWMPWGAPLASGGVAGLGAAF